MKPIIIGCGRRAPPRRKTIAALKRPRPRAATGLRPQPVDLLQLLAADAIAVAGVDVGLRDPPAQALLPDADLPRHRLNRGRRGRVLAPVRQHQTHRSSLQLGIDQLRYLLILLDSNRSGIKP